MAKSMNILNDNHILLRRYDIYYNTQESYYYNILSHDYLNDINNNIHNHNNYNRYLIQHNYNSDYNLDNNNSNLDNINNNRYYIYQDNLSPMIDIKCTLCKHVQLDVKLYYQYIEDCVCPICLENQKWYLPCSYSNQHILSCLECYCDITKNYSPEKRCKLCNINIEILGPKKNYNGIFYAWCGKC
jgi:hypothetical protein